MHPVGPGDRRNIVYEKLSKANLHCDLCGKKPADGEIYQNKKFICLCPDCLEKLDEMPCNMKEKMENYIMGNVL